MFCYSLALRRSEDTTKKQNVNYRGLKTINILTKEEKNPIK